VREKRAPPAVVETQERATRRLVRQEIRQARSVEPCLAAGKQRAQATLLLAPLPRARLARREWQSDRLALAFFAPGP